jgi:cytochrome P450
MFNSATLLFERISIKDVAIGEIPINRGAVVDGLWFNQLYDPERFPSPLLFQPERWEL